MAELTIRVQDEAGIDSPRPVTGGVPIPEGAAPEGTTFTLTDASGSRVPLQTQVLAPWKDGSARWVLLDFVGEPPKGGVAEYSLSSSGQDENPLPETPVTPGGQDVLLGNGPLCLAASKSALLRIADRLDVSLVLVDDRGRLYRATVESTEIECAGPVRGTVLLRGRFLNDAGEPFISFRLRASLYADSALVRLEPLILVDADQGLLQRFRELCFSVQPTTRARGVALGGDPGWFGLPNRQVRLLQVDDRTYRLEGAEGKGKRAPGWAEVTDDKGTVALALREFWQQWPKSLECSEGRLDLGLFPAFEAGTFDHMEPWHKYLYLFDGDCYRLRTGQARRWDIWLDLAGDGEALARKANVPLIPLEDPAQAIATGVWGELAPLGAEGMSDYDAWAENLCDAYVSAIEAQRDYGAMNWGDWYGERVVNWGNHEYDTTNQILIQFARTGDPQYFYVADAAAHHSAEVDTVHYVNDDLDNYFQTNWPHPTYPSRPGLVHEHSVGHVGAFYSIEQVRELFVENGIGSNPASGYINRNPYLCLDPFNLGHVWTQGMTRQYFLTGDPFLRETVEMIANNLAQLAEDREYHFMGHSHCGRTTGWPLLALAGAYELGFEERYLNAMRLLVDDALEGQDRVCGGWLFTLPKGHCYCDTSHVGMAGFLTAILINGLSRYYLLTGDERLPEAIERAVVFLNNDTWREEWRDWRYTSCPASQPVGQLGVEVMALVNSVRITGNAEHLRILRLAWEAKFERLLRAPEPGPGVGKTFSHIMYGSAETASLLALRKE